MSRSHRKALIAAIFVVPVLCCFIGIGALLIVVFWWGMHGFGFTGPLNTVPLEKTPDWSPWVRLLGRGPTADRIIDIAHERLRRPAPADGVLFQYLHNRHGHLAFFVGQRSKKGWWYGSFQKFCNTAHGGNGEQRGILGLIVGAELLERAIRHTACGLLLRSRASLSSLDTASPHPTIRLERATCRGDRAWRAVAMDGLSALAPGGYPGITSPSAKRRRRVRHDHEARKWVTLHLTRVEPYSARLPTTAANGAVLPCRAQSKKTLLAAKPRHPATTRRRPSKSTR